MRPAHVLVAARLPYPRSAGRAPTRGARLYDQEPQEPRRGRPERGAAVAARLVLGVGARVGRAAARRLRRDAVGYGGLLEA
eukprot:1656052-Prymnesium_polylepis.1